MAPIRLIGYKALLHYREAVLEFLMLILKSYLFDKKAFNINWIYGTYVYESLCYLGIIFGMNYSYQQFIKEATAVHLQTVKTIALVKHIWRCECFHNFLSDTVLLEFYNI